MKADRTGEIIAEIVALLRDPDVVIEPDEVDPTKAYVKDAINYLRQLNRLGRPMWGNRKENLESLTSVRDAVAGLQAAIGAMPDAALALLCAFEKSGTAETVPAAQVQRRMTARLEQLTGMLALYRARCDELLAEPPGKHGSTRFRQEWAALAARDLLIVHNKQPTMNPTGAFLAVAARLYEAMTGNEPEDSTMSRACRAVLGQ
jgi:hypothetical protein